MTLAARAEVTGLSLREGRARAGKVARLSYVRLPVPLAVPMPGMHAARNGYAAESPNRRP
ncbi:hypothetical protein OHA37_24110 [Streptomyces sp. NBC_00335]|uniref:hypothetical protein n=1 Tax=unclassified Streptomyces TaxID=2593676 RepID=UPI00225B8152|nr:MULTISPECIES: hypothetical protein [unclassified Streptomyces]MCX5406944.1 hypothetical protein [Streptomyces sp. NBC_00086]